ERLQSYILTQPVIGVDETRWKLLAAKNKNQGGRGKVWQIWAICCPDAAHYSFEDSRSVEAAKTVLGDYSGTILTDGYVSYESLKKSSGRFEQAYCWAHVRRKFFEIKDQQPEKCERILDLIGELYAVEKDAREGPPDEVLALRKERSKPIITAIQHWMLETEAFPESPLGKAIKYMAKRWDGLRLFLDDANVSLDNNATERALRGLVVGRKNHYGSRSVRGTQVAAILYSLIESAKLAGVGVHTYLKTAITAALRGHVIPLPHETV